MRFALVDDKEELRDHVAMLLGEFAAAALQTRLFRKR